MSEDQTWNIYCITNTVTGKKYIGLTKKTISHRWRAHLWDAKAVKYGSMLHASIRKYGTVAFSVDVIYIATSKREAVAVERGLIAAHGTFVPRGYNLTPGGDGHDGPHKPFTPETLEKMRQAKLGRKLTQEHKDKIGAAHRGRKKTPEWAAKIAASQIGKKRKPFTEEQRKRHAESLVGRIVTQETKEKISKSNTGKKRSDEVRKNASDFRMGKPHKLPPPSSGLRGAYKAWHSTRWFSHIKINGKKVYLGMFKTAQEAHEAYRRAAIEAFGDNAVLE